MYNTKKNKNKTDRLSQRTLDWVWPGERHITQDCFGCIYLAQAAFQAGKVESLRWHGGSQSAITYLRSRLIALQQGVRLHMCAAKTTLKVAEGAARPIDCIGLMPTPLGLRGRSLHRDPLLFWGGWGGAVFMNEYSLQINHALSVESLFARERVVAPTNILRASRLR